jgi:beta-1,3-galactosyltransferase 1
VRKKQNLMTAAKTLILVCGLVVVIVFINIKRDFEDNSIKNRPEWLGNNNFLPHYVKPDEDTAIFVPKNMSSIKERKFIACFVISASRNRLSRDAVRKTWGKLIKPIFLMGLNDKDTTKLVTQEAEEFNDIIIEDFVDSYVNLTVKTAFAMKNFLTHFNSSKYFFKIDDDAFLNVEGLHKHLQIVPVDSLIGQSESHSIPIRDESHRWYIPEFLYDGDTFPPYLLGLSYLIPGKI